MTESGKQFVSDLAPRSTDARAILTKPLLNQVEMPFRDRNGLRLRSDSIPQRLYVIELLINGEFVKSRRRVRYFSCHAIQYNPMPRSGLLHLAGSWLTAQRSAASRAHILLWI